MYRRQKLVYQLNTSGKYFAFKEQLKYSVVKIVREKYLRTTNFASREELEVTFATNLDLDLDLYRIRGVLQFSCIMVTVTLYTGVPQPAVRVPTGRDARGTKQVPAGGGPGTGTRSSH